MHFKRFPPLFWLTSGLAIAGVLGVWLVPSWLAAYRSQQQALQQQQATLEAAKGLQTEKKYLECVNRAAEIPAASAVHAAAQTLMNVCQQQLQTNLLEQAQSQAARRQFKAAIDLVRRIPATSPLKQTAQSSMAVWADQLLRQAIDLAENQGKIQEASALASGIPVELPLSQTAQQKIAAWSRDWRTNSPHFNALEAAAARKDWLVVKQSAEQIAPTTPFWQKQRDYWQTKANTELAAIAKKQAEAAKRRQAEIEAQQLTQPQCAAIRDAYLQGNPYVKQAVEQNGGVVKLHCRNLGVEMR